MKIRVSICTALTLLFLGASCGNDDEPVTTTQTFDLFIDYWNPTGTDPQISFDQDNSNTDVKIDFTDTFEGVVTDNNTANVIIDNVRIVDTNNKNYEIDQIDASYYIEASDLWRSDKEFVMDYSYVEDLSVVLVLDASKSLEEDFIRVQESAKEFVNRIFETSATAKVGVVAFSDTISTLELTNDESSILAFINDIEQGSFTRLYQAMSQGYDLLSEIESQGKVLVTFTDGVDNLSDTDTYSFENIEQQLVTNNEDVNSFIIGLGSETEIAIEELERLIANGGTASFPTSIAQLETVFSDVSKSVSNVYNLSYERSKQVISKEDAIKLRFKITASQK